MDGFCDIPGCTGETYMGCRPSTEHLGKQICEYHWGRHKDAQDSFGLFEVFGFRRPVRIPKPVAKKEVGRCACGRERLRGRKFCTECAAERERQRKREAYHKRKNGSQQEPAEPEPILRCKACGAERELGHTYCQRCAERRRKVTRRQAQSRYWRNQQKC
jgi:hypothetical protein